MTSPNSHNSTSLESIEIPLKLDTFLQNLLSYLAGTLEDVVGIEDAAGFIAVVGNLIGEEINQFYNQALGEKIFSPAEVANILVDIKRRIGGSFYIIEQNDEKIVLGNHKCPLGNKVQGHPSLCMMTSNVFGVVTAQSLGYAKVVIEKAIAQYDAGCRVVVYLQPTEEALNAQGREYHRI